MLTKPFVGALALAIGAAGLTGVAAAGPVGKEGRHGPRLIRVVFRPDRIDLARSASISVSGTAARSVEVRLAGATDRAGLAFEWTPYRWRPLQRRHGRWRGVLPAPALRGIYRLQLRIDDGRRILSSARWLLRVFPHGVLARRSFSTAVAAVRDFVAHLPGDEILVALRRWPQAAFDHRNPRLHRLFVIAYAPRDDNRLSSRLGSFITTVRDGLAGRWRILEATTAPYGP